jgi:type IV secretory pathway VirB10-like protein
MKHINTTYSQFSWILCIFLLALPLLSHAEIYKWKDKDGKVRYSDTPPPSNIKQEAHRGKKSVQGMNKEPLAAVAAPAKEAVSKEDEAAKQRQRNAEAEKRNKQEKEAEAKRKAENCSAAKANLETYTQGGRVYKMNEKGEREYMDDNDFKAGKEKSQQEVNENC